MANNFLQVLDYSKKANGVECLYFILLLQFKFIFKCILYITVLY